MTTFAPSQATAVSGVRTAFGIGGWLALAAGILILVWPGRTAMVVTAIIAIYAMVAGVVYAGLGIFGKAKGAWSRVGHITLGAVFVVAAVLAFLNLGQTTVGLAVFLGVLVGVMWIVEGIVAFSTLGDAASRGWSTFFAIVSVAAGIMLLISPMWGAAALWWLLGISFIVLGSVNIVRGFKFGSRRRRAA